MWSVCTQHHRSWPLCLRILSTAALLGVCSSLAGLCTATEPHPVCPSSCSRAHRVHHLPEYCVGSRNRSPAPLPLLQRCSKAPELLEVVSAAVSWQRTHRRWLTHRPGLPVQQECSNPCYLPALALAMLCSTATSADLSAACASERLRAQQTRAQISADHRDWSLLASCYECADADGHSTLDGSIRVVSRHFLVPCPT